VPIDLAAAYEETRDDLLGVVRSLPEDRLATNVPATPDWDVRDVVAHLTGVASIVANGGAPPELNLLEGVRNPVQGKMRDDMNDAEMDRRRGRPLDELVAEWDRLTTRLAPMVRGEEAFPQEHPFLGHVIVTDIAVHAQDVRNALGRPGGRESAGVGVALVSYAVGVGFTLDQKGIPALRIRYGEKERIVGSGDPAATWGGERYEVCRALSGRRSIAQIRAMSWEGDPEPYLPVIPAYGGRDDDLVE
jgi:uncharacterized protein (TIGR03083 family)